MNTKNFLRFACMVFFLFTVSPASAHAQSYSPLLLPATFTYGVAYCADPDDGHRIPYCPIFLMSRPYYFTNAHLHNVPIAPNSLVCLPGDTCYVFVMEFSDANGNFPFYLLTNLIGHAEYITVMNFANGNVNFFDHAVGYGDLFYNDHPEIWFRTGGDDTGGGTYHGTTVYNRYMRLDAAIGLYNATVQVYLPAHPGQEKICTNDMALPFGGKFDIDQNWISPHFWHDRGTAVDVAGPGSGQCPDEFEANLQDFLQACIARGAIETDSFGQSISHIQGNHVHCDWEEPINYPH